MITYGLIGFPLLHSGSQTYFTGKFRREKIAGRQYKLFSLPEIYSLKKLIRDNEELCGLNVTIPYKESILPFLDELDPVAGAIGAVNTVKITRQGGSLRLKGYNTDAAGFDRSLPADEYAQALILGTGGASKAVAFVLKNRGIRFLCVSRNKKNPGMITYADLTNEFIRQYKLIINTTPLGMFPETSSFPLIPYSGLTKEHFLYDLVYNPVQTEFLRKGKSAGAKVRNGMEMLHYQADLSYEYWEK